MLKNLHTMEDIKIAKPLIKDFFYELCQNGSHELTHDQLYQAALTDNIIRTIIEKNTRILRKYNNDEYITPSQYLVRNEDSNQTGIFFPAVDNLFFAY